MVSKKPGIFIALTMLSIGFVNGFTRFRAASASSGSGIASHPIHGTLFAQFRSKVEYKYRRKSTESRKVTQERIHNLPYTVKRTPSGNLPVYTRMSQRKAPGEETYAAVGQIVTRVQHVCGDLQYLVDDLEKNVNLDTRGKNKVRIWKDKRIIEFRGAVDGGIKEYFQTIGF